MLVAVTVVLFSERAILAQTGSGTASIAGEVRDTSGAVLPGVTVEATSPALIEKVRTVTADERGQYQIIQLPPGMYAVTMSLSGFSGVKREGVQLTTGFTATVKARCAWGPSRRRSRSQAERHWSIPTTRVSKTCCPQR
jgi:hypothetical protein